MQLLFLAVAGVALALTAALSVGLRTRRTGLARLIVQRAPFDLRPDAVDWLVPPSRVTLLEGCLPTALAAAVAIAAGIQLGLSWKALIGVPIVLRVAWWVGEEHGKVPGPLPPALLRMARRARERAARPSTVGDPDAGAKAYALAQWIEALCGNAPRLTIEQLEAYYTTHQVADILESHFSGDSDDWELNKWLERTMQPLYESPEEEVRVSLLEQARRDLAGAPPPERVREIIDRLRQ